MTHLHRERVSAVIKVGGSPDWQTIGFGSVWVANSAVGVQRVDPATNRVETPIPVSQPCAGLTSGFGAVWSEDCALGELDRIDPKSMKIEAHIPLVPATDEGYIAAGSHGVWVAGSVGLSRAGLVRVNPQTNHVVTRIPMPGTPAAVAASFDAVWVTLPDQGMVVRVNPSSNKVVARIKVHPGPRFLATGEDAVWVLSQSDGSVARIDPSTNRVAATIRANVPGEGGCIAAGEGSVWVTMPQTPVIRIDPGDNRVAERYTGAGGDCISAGLGSVWLSNHDFGDIWRIKP